MDTDQLQQLGRAKNAILSYFEQHLSIPKIYIDATWDGHHIDLLAINRDGVGDVHIVLLETVEPRMNSVQWEHLIKSCDSLLDRLDQVPAQYKYVALISDHERYVLPGIPPPVLERSLSPDGIGKVGFFSVALKPHEEPHLELLFKPERFRAKVAKLADEYVQQHEADWEIRA